MQIAVRKTVRNVRTARVRSRPLKLLHIATLDAQIEFRPPR